LRSRLIPDFTRSIGICALAVASLGNFAGAQQALTWEQVKAKFEVDNPALRADAINVEEMKAEEITAFLRPNPQFTAAMDGTQLARHAGVWQPLAGAQYQGSLSYLHERERKRELRLESAKEGTQITASQHEDLERNMLFSLRSMFVQTLEAKAVLAPVSRQAISRRSIWTVSNCCACSMKRRLRRRSSIFVRPSTSCCSCSMNLHRWTVRCDWTFRLERRVEATGGLPSGCAG